MACVRAVTRFIFPAPFDTSIAWRVSRAAAMRFYGLIQSIFGLGVLVCFRFAVRGREQRFLRLVFILVFVLVIVENEDVFCIRFVRFGRLLFRSIRPAALHPAARSCPSSPPRAPPAARKRRPHRAGAHGGLRPRARRLPRAATASALASFSLRPSFQRGFFPLRLDIRAGEGTDDDLHIAHGYAAVGLDAGADRLSACSW